MIFFLKKTEPKLSFRRMSLCMSKLPFLLLCFFFGKIVFSGVVHQIILTDSNLMNSHGKSVGVFEDVNDEYTTYEAISQLPDSLFVTGKESILDFNFTNNSYWLFFKLNNQSSYTHFLIEAGRTVTNKVELYEVVNGEVRLAFQSGDDYDYFDKEIEHRKNIFPVELDSNEIKSFYIHLESDGELLFSPLMVHERMAFFAQDFKDQFKNGFYYGLIALVVIIYFFFFLFLRDKTYLFYILYAFSQGVLQFSLDGYTHHHFFPNGGYFTNHVLLVFAGLTVVFLLTYVNKFLQLKERSRLLWQIFKVTRIVMIAIILLSLIPGYTYEISFPIINGASLFSVLLAAFTIIRLRVKGYAVDFFFALAFIILIIGGVVFILGNLSIVGDKLVSLGALKISSALEFVVLSISMSKKYGELQREKDAAQKLAFQNLQEKNMLIDQQNAMLEQQVSERTAELEIQKEALAYSKNEIVSSIKYAERIQRAILPALDGVKKLLPHSFFYFKPKDVVSGDFYFVETALTSDEPSQNHILIAAVDCTGHGVPGAFMSIIGNNLLTQASSEKTVNSPGEVLNFLNKGVNKTLRRTVEGSVIRDGMDIAMCTYNPERKELMFAGAKNPLYLIRKKSNLNQESLDNSLNIIEETESHVLLQIKGDRYPIGNAFEEVVHTFQNHTLDILEGDQIYIFTDGFADQFGGTLNKKYNYKRFRQFLLLISEYPMEVQEVKLDAEFEKWRGSNPQIDDVLIIGVQF